MFATGIEPECDESQLGIISLALQPRKHLTKNHRVQQTRNYPNYEIKIQRYNNFYSFYGTKFQLKNDLFSFM